MFSRSKQTKNPTDRNSKQTGESLSGVCLLQSSLGLQLRSIHSAEFVAQRISPCAWCLLRRVVSFAFCWNSAFAVLAQKCSRSPATLDVPDQCVHRRRMQIVEQRLFTEIFRAIFAQRENPPEGSPACEFNSRIICLVSFVEYFFLFESLAVFVRDGRRAFSMVGMPSKGCTCAGREKKIRNNVEFRIRTSGNMHPT